MNRFVKPGAIAERRGSEQADAADHRAELVGKYIAEKVVGQQHIETFGRRHQLEGRGVDVAVLQLDIGVFARHLDHRTAPKAARGQHIGLIDRADPAATFPGQLEADFGHPAGERGRLAPGIESFVVAFLAWFAEINAAEQVAHHQEVGTGHQLGT